MTDEELDQARADEAWGISNEQRLNYGIVAARLAREGWMPVDPLLIEAREIVAKRAEQDGYEVTLFRQGKLDASPDIVIALAALKRGIEIGKEKAGD